ncbi:MAG: SsrA-binding protein SmpB [Desulfovibrionaceae bacterium]
MSKKGKTSPGVLATNKKARHNYELLDFWEAGMSLMGSEVKSVRAGKVSFMDGYVAFRGGEAFLVGVHIAPYENQGYAGHVPDRDRKLLLHAHELKEMTTQVEQKGLTIVPTKMYLKNGKIKLELALGRGKKQHDRREDLKERATARDTARELAAR